MRYYGEEYLNDVTRTIAATKNAVDSPDYKIPIENSFVKDNRYELKQRGVDIAGNAFRHVNDLKDKLDTLQSLLNTFYAETDESAARVVDMTGTVMQLINATTSSLTEMTQMLRGVGSYAGVEITSKHIISAGLDKDKCAILTAKVWSQIVESGIESNELDENAVDKYVTCLQDWEKHGNELSREDFDKLLKLFDYYVSDRYGSTGDIRDMDRQVVTNVINVFEVLNPFAQYVTESFFEGARSSENYIVDLNIDRIKYAMYTAEPKLRDIMLYYISDVYIADYGAERNGFENVFNNLRLALETSYDNKAGGVYIEDNPFYSFFHEFGHAIDDVSTLFGTASAGMNTTLVSDLKADMVRAVNDAGLTFLTDTELDQVIDFMVSSKNVNVRPPKGEGLEYLLPADWSMDQVGVFCFLKNYYGYYEYTYEEDPDIVYTCSEDPYRLDNSPIRDVRECETISDIIGGLTNNQTGGSYVHHIKEPPFDPKKIKGPEDIADYLEKNSYWYKNGKLKNNAEVEFFAEYFNNNVVGYGVEETRAIFGKSCDRFDKIIDKMYNDMPDAYKGINY